MRTRGKHTDAGSGERGTALIYALLIALAMAGMSSALLGMSLGSGNQRERARESQRTFYAAEAGLADAVMRFQQGLVARPAENEIAYLGTPEVPMQFGSSSYWVEIAQLDSRSYTVTSHGTEEGTRESIQIVLADVPDGFFQWSAFGASGVNLDSNAMIDSFDSMEGTYMSQIQPGTDYARENGHIGSNADIVLGSNTQVHGDARPGPGGVLDDSSPGAYVSGRTDPLEEPYEMLPIVVPAIASSGSISTSGDVVLGPGDVHLDALTINGGDTVTIVGPANLVVDDLLAKAGGTLHFDGTNGMIDVFGTGDFELLSNSNVVTQSTTALDVTLLLSGDTSASPPDRVNLSSNSVFVGAVYAPFAEFSLGSNFEVFGSVICDYLDLSSNGLIHFDEALRYDGFGASDEYVVALWRRVAHQ